MTKHVHIRFLNVLIRSVLLYGGEIWTLRAQDRNVIEATQMRFLRSVEKLTIRDKSKGNETRKELKTKNFTDAIMEYLT